MLAFTDTMIVLGFRATRKSRGDTHEAVSILVASWVLQIHLGDLGSPVPGMAKSAAIAGAQRSAIH